MDKVWYWKNKLMFLVITTIFSAVFFGKICSVTARDNAYLACFVDDSAYMFKTQVVFTAQELELARLKILTLGDKNGLNYGDDRMHGDTSANTIDTYNKDTIEFLKLSRNDDRVKLMGPDGRFIHIPAQFFGINKEIYGTIFKLNKGVPYLGVSKLTKEQLKGMEGTVISDKVGITYGTDPYDVDWNKLAPGDNKNYVLPLTFPAVTTKSAKNSDINRAYEVQDALSDDFKDALLFLNGGKAYTDVDTLFETAYYLVTSDSGGVTKITNSDGVTYAVAHLGVSSDEPYLYKIKIWDANNVSKDNTAYFNFKVKKGYLGCATGERTEAGTTNTVSTTKMREDLKETDTTWISWEHLYLEAAILYAQGVTYSNQADLYTTDELENGIVKLCRSLLNGLTGLMQFYSLEELIFNKGIRGGRAFVYGAYYENWSPYISTIFVIFLSIALSLVTILFVNILMKNQLSVISPTMRVSLMSDITKLIFCMFMVGSIWWIIKFLLLCNFKFVEVWASFVGDKTLESVGGSYSVLATIIFQFAYFVINIYVNFMYIIRSLFIAALIMLAPIFIIIGAFSPKTMTITKSWATSLVGYIFVQSIHSFVYGFVIVASPGLRGIESVVICSSIIPLTTFIKDLFGMDLKAVEKSAGAMTATGVMAGAGALSMAGNVAAKGSEVAGGAIGATVGGISAHYNASRDFRGIHNRNELMRAGEQAKLTQQIRDRVSNNARSSQGGTGALTPGQSLRYNQQRQGIDAKYAQSTFATMKNQGADVKRGVKEGSQIGRTAGRMVGGASQVATGLTGMAYGFGYTAATGDKSYIPSQSMTDIGRGLSMSADSVGDLYSDTASGISSGAYVLSAGQILRDNRRSRPPRGATRPVRPS